MLGKTHLVFGLFISLLGLTLFDIGNPIGFLFIVLFASLFPDIDEPHSYLGRKVKFIGWIFKHRGFFHSIVWMGLCMWIVYLLFHEGIYIMGFGVGFLGHLFLDLLTQAGLKTWPLPHLKGKIHVGSWVEMVFFWFLLVTNGYLVIKGGL